MSAHALLRSGRRSLLVIVVSGQRLVGRPRVSPLATTAMPSQTSGRGSGSTESDAAGGGRDGGDPGQQPSDSGPSRRTLEYHRAKASAVTATAR